MKLHPSRALDVRKNKVVFSSTPTMQRPKGSPGLGPLSPFDQQPCVESQDFSFWAKGDEQPTQKEDSKAGSPEKQEASREGVTPMDLYTVSSPPRLS